MRSILNDVIDEYIVSKSRFVTFLVRCDDVSLVSSILANIKNEYKGATHYCYAYIINNMEKAVDDGEPSGTAGLPILNILKHNDLQNVICVVVRYFGGIKLGAGGLIRAYSTSSKNCVLKADLIPYKRKIDVVIKFDYNNVEIINSLVMEYVVEKEFLELITYKLCIDDDFDFSQIDDLVIEKRIL